MGMKALTGDTAVSADLPQLSLGPIQYYWPRKQVFEFYEAIAESRLDIVYLGETVCGKRREMKPKDWLAIGRQLQARGKAVVLSSLLLIEAASELGALRRSCGSGEFMVEANDMAAVYRLHQARRGFVGGAGLNVYNARALERLRQCGLQRLVTQVELSVGTLHALHEAVPGVEMETMVWGCLPLAFSARCFTARAENLQKDQCGFACIRDPAGRLVETREGEPELRLNGIQTQSARTQCLAAEYRALRELGVAVWRINPQAEHGLSVVDVFDRLRHEDITPATAQRELQGLADVGLCDGYWRGEAGRNLAVAYCA